MRAWLNYSLRKLFGVNCEGSLIDYSCELANDPPKERVNLRSPCLVANYETRLDSFYTMHIAPHTSPCHA